MLPLIPVLASLAVQQGPALIRGIASMFGGSDTAAQVADIVEQVGKAGLPANDQVNLVAAQLATMPAEAQVEMTKLKVALEQEATRRQELQFADKQAEQSQTQETIRSGDNAADAYVRQTRPLMARQSWQMTAIYVMTFSLLQAWGRGTGPDFDIVLMLMTPALAYLGLRTLDGWAPYPKASGDKVAGAITALLPGKK
jgi:hypothetical protein